MSIFLGMPRTQGEQRSGSARDLLEQVVERGWCIGCGACASLPGSALEIAMDDSGRFQARPRPGGKLDVVGPYLDVCPFSAPFDEDHLAAAFLDVADTHRTGELGHFRSTFAGHASANDLRDEGSSGGLTTWFVDQLLADGEVDAVIHVGQNGGHGNLFGYRVSSTRDEVRQNAKTRYYPVEMSEVLDFVRSREGRYAVVGLPCFIKALRLLQVEDPVFAERVRYCVGLVCGHQKSARFADAMAWEQGVAPGDLEAIDFRKKTDTRADSYEVATVDRSGVVRSAPNHAHLVADWGMGMFKYPACDWCDDVMNETADVAFGDAWLPEYVGDPRGANVVVVRSQQAQDLIDRHADDLAISELSPEQTAQSQAAGLRHRREGLAYRLYRDAAAGRPTPRKRVAASADISPRRKQIFDQRQDLLVAADAAYSASSPRGEFSVFRRRLMPAVARYQTLYETTTPARLRGLVRRRLPFVRRTLQRIRNWAHHSPIFGDGR